MNTRIKYNYDGHIGISRQTFKVDNGQDVRIVINKEDFKFEIVDDEGRTLIEGGNTSNYNVLLRQAKRALVKLGHEFGVEKRDRDYGLVKKEVETESPGS